jgi:transcription antitermination factor NusG
MTPHLGLDGWISVRMKQLPPPQSPEGSALTEFQGLWWVAHTKPRQEKALAWDIFRSGGNYFLPMYEVIKRSRTRRWTSVLPLFTGYVFLCCNERTRLRALETHRIAKLISVPDQAGLVVELTRIGQLLAGGMSINPYPGLTRGAACRIRTGPMVGLEGRVERRKGQARFIVNVTILGQGAAVEIDADWLEPIE